MHEGTDPGTVSYRGSLAVACSVIGYSAPEDQARSFIRRHEKLLLAYVYANRGRLLEIYARDEKKLKAQVLDQGQVIKSKSDPKTTKSIKHKKPNKTAGRSKFVSAQTRRVSGDEFLQSYEWRKIRMVALKKYGPKCQCCGATPADGAVMNVDHVKPRKLFPHLALDVNNLQILCHECNHGKGNWDMTDWRESHEDCDAGLR